MTPTTNIKRTDPEMIPEPAATARPITTSRASGRPARILLAEDDREMRELLGATLRADGYQVLESSNGFEMLEEIEMLLFGGDAMPLDLIVSDERMPGMLGLEALACIREAKWPTPFILITAFGDRETHADAHRLGAAAIFDKPFDLDDLRWTVARLLVEPGSRGESTAAGPTADRTTDAEGNR